MKPVCHYIVALSLLNNFVAQNINSYPFTGNFAEGLYTSGTAGMPLNTLGPSNRVETRMNFLTIRFDTIIDFVNNPTYPFNSYDLSQITNMVLDSIEMNFVHNRDASPSQQYDTIEVSIMNWCNSVSDDTGCDDDSLIWKGTIITDTSLTATNTFGSFFITPPSPVTGSSG